MQLGTHPIIMLKIVPKWVMTTQSTLGAHLFLYLYRCGIPQLFFFSYTPVIKTT